MRFVWYILLAVIFGLGGAGFAQQGDPQGFTPQARDTGSFIVRTQGRLNHAWSYIQSDQTSAAHGLKGRVAQIRMLHPQIDEYWTAASGALVLRSNLVLTAAHSFYDIPPNPRNGRCSCAPRRATHGPNAIADMQGLGVRLYQPDAPARANQLEIEKAFPDNHCRFVRQVAGKCMIPAESDFVVLRLDGFLIDGQPLSLSQSHAAPSQMQMAGFPSALEGETLVSSACQSLGEAPTRWRLPTVKLLGGATCEVSKGMSGGPVTFLGANTYGQTDMFLDGIVLAAQKDRVIYRKRDEQIDRCVRAAAAWNGGHPALSVVALGYTGENDCPVIER